MQKFGSKRSKALAANGWAAKESLSVQKTERVMDVELFLEGQTKWEADSPHHLMMLYELFQHAADQGWKEAEQTVCRGHWQEIPKLDPEADLSTVQLVGPQTSKEEIQSLYLEVYKQHRLLGSPPRELELMEEVASSFEDCQGQKEEEVSEMAVRFWSADVQPPRSRTPKRGRREASVERSLANMRGAHQKALAMAAVLEEEIEQLSCPLIRSQPEVQAHSKSRDCQLHGSRGRKRRCCQVQFANCPAPYFKYHPSRRNSKSDKEVAATKGPDLEELPELGPEVICFLRGLAENSEEEDKMAPSPKPPVKELCKWVMWKAEACKTPSWQRELVAVPEIEDQEKLAHEVQASFWHPKWASEVHQMDNYHQAPSALPCLLSKSFMPPPDSIYTCWDIWEMQREKTVAYTWALQYWVEKADLPAGGGPCMLAESVKELWEEMRYCLSFSNKEVFKGIVPLEETSAIPTEEANPQSAGTTPASTPKKEATMGMAKEPATEGRPPNKFLAWEKVLHPTLPMVAAGQIPCLSKGPRLRKERIVQIPQTELLEVMTPLQEIPSPTWQLEVIWQATLSPSFLGVTECLRRAQTPERVSEVSPDLLTIGVMLAPGVATMSTSHIVKDEVTGITYMDMVTTSVGRVALCSPEQETPAQGSTIEDVTDLVWGVAR